MSTAPTSAPPAPPDTVYVSFSADVNPTTTEGLLKTCCELANAGVKTIYILLSTIGGQVACGINIFNVLRALPSKIIMHNVGIVNSIGNAIFLAGEERYANPGTTFMFHGVSLPIQSQVEEKKLLECLDEVKSATDKIVHVIRERARFAKEDDITQLFVQAATRDTKFAKQHGIIDDVREAKVPVGSPILQLGFTR